MDLSATAITASSALNDVGSVAQTVARADARAEDTARMARQLLSVLREVRLLGCGVLAWVWCACLGEVCLLGCVILRTQQRPSMQCSQGIM